MREAAAFIGKQIQASVFPLCLFASLALAQALSPWLPRYDLLFVLCLAIQVCMVRSGMETRRELAVICVFHVLGLGLEQYKVAHGSWTYPDAGFKVNGVPPYSGFMYASVASYMMQAWRRFNLKLDRWPAWPWLLSAAAAIYLNFFLSRTIGDVRFWILLFVAAVFWRCRVSFASLSGKRRSMPVVLSFFLIGLHVWFAEHLCTWLGAWQYPYQQDRWQFVDSGKLSSWVMMVIVSFIIVASLKGRKVEWSETVDLLPETA